MRLASESFVQTSRSPVERLRRQFERPRATNTRRAAAFVLENENQSTEERRKLPRHPMRIGATLSAEDSDQLMEIHLKDINAQFAGFVSRHPIELGSRGSLRLIGNRGAAIELTGTVGRCRQQADGWYEGFIAFDKPINPLDSAA